MQFLKVFLFLSAIVALAFCVPPPSIPKDLLEQALSHSHGAANGKRLADAMPYVDRNVARSDAELTESEFHDLVILLKQMHGPIEKLGYSEIMDLRPEIWHESRAPMTFSLPVYAFDQSGGIGSVILHGRGNFTSTIECRQDWCLFFNRRATEWAYLGGCCQDGDYSNAVYAPAVYDNALFAVKGDGKMVGFDLALVGTGRYASEAYGNSVFGPNTNVPVFVNFVNPKGLVTADVFTTKPGRQGGDVSRGTNDYSPLITTAPQPNSTAPELVIKSVAYILDPYTNEPLLMGYQDTRR